MPTEVKPLFGKSKKAAKEAEGLKVMNSVYYFRITPATAKAMASLDPQCNRQRSSSRNCGNCKEVEDEEAGKRAGVGSDSEVEEVVVSSAVRLLHKFFVNLQTDPTYSGRFKAIGIGFNFEEVEMTD